MPYLKSLAAAIAWTWLCLLPTSCLDLGSEDEEKDGQKDVLFRNASSYTVTVMPGSASPCRLERPTWWSRRTSPADWSTGSARETASTSSTSAPLKSSSAPGKASG